MIIIIDGYNLMFHECWPYIEGELESRRKTLIDLVVNFKKRTHLSRVIIVFDGCSGVGPYKQQIHQAGVEIIYAICQGKADEKIIDLSRGLNNVVVVTADRRVVKYTKRNKSDIIPPPVFTRKLLRVNQNSQKQRETMPHNNVDKWLDEFGLDEEIEIPEYLDEKLPKIPNYSYVDEEEDANEHFLLDEKSVEEWLEWFRMEDDTYE